ARLDFAALHGERDVVATGIAGDELHLRAEDAVHRLGEEIGIGARTGAADEHLPRIQVFELRDAALAPGGADAHFIVGAADPAEFRRGELGAWRAEQRIERDATADGAEDAAVARR